MMLSLTIQVKMLELELQQTIKQSLYNNVYKAINREDFVLVPGESRLVSIYVEAEDGTQKFISNL